MKIGDYVRTKQGRIGKISNLTVDYSSELILCEESSIPFAKHQIIKSSPNIIDLIEVGDYVNGTIVTKTVLDEIECKYIELDYTYNKRGIREKDIKSIVTHEQFSAMEYKVESEVK